MPEIEKRRSVKKNDTREAVSAQAANDRVEGKKKKKTLAPEAPTPKRARRTPRVISSSRSSWTRAKRSLR